MALGFGLLWMVTVGIVSQFVPRMISVGQFPARRPDDAHRGRRRGPVRQLLLGLAGQKIGTKTASVIYSASYIIALLLLIFAKLPIFTYIAIVFVGLGIGGLLNLMPSMVTPCTASMTSPPPTASSLPSPPCCRSSPSSSWPCCWASPEADYALPYGVFIVIDVIGAALLLCVTGKCKGKQD